MTPVLVSRDQLISEVTPRKLDEFIGPVNVDLAKRLAFALPELRTKIEKINVELEVVESELYTVVTYSSNTTLSDNDQQLFMSFINEELIYGENAVFTFPIKTTEEYEYHITV